MRLEGWGYFLIRAKTQVANLVENWEGVVSFFSVPVMKPNGQRHLREGEFYLGLQCQGVIGESAIVER